MTYQEIYDSYSTSSGVRDRCIVAITKFARYILGGGGGPSAARITWAQDALQNPGTWADRVRWGITGDPQYMIDGPSITDENLQTAVETALNTMIPA